MSIWDECIDAASDALPKFNTHTLKDYRQSQIKKCVDFMAMAYQEATRLFEGEITYKGYRILGPEERLKSGFYSPKYGNGNLDITNTELMLVEYMFEYQKTIYTSQLFLPYLIDNAIIINGSKYYIQFALTDSVFYHITKENGIGIKVLRAHLKFWRNQRHSFMSVRGTRYNDNLIIVKAHMKSYKYNSEDLRPALVLYPLTKFGWYVTLERYGIKPGQIDLVTKPDKYDKDFEYFEIRKCTKEKPGLYLKASTEILSTNPDLDIKNQMCVVSSIHYILQYFVRWTSTMYQNNEELIHLLKHDPENLPWKIILGKTIFGIAYANEIQAGNHAIQHLESLDSYLDNYTRLKLEEIGVYCNNIYELLDHVFLNMDTYVVGYAPANLYEKRVNILDLLLGNMIQNLFHKVYKKTNNKKGGKSLIDAKDVDTLFKMGRKAIAQIHKCNQVVAGNPAVYNDNYLLTVGGRKVRATHSATAGGVKAGAARAAGKATGNQKANLMSSPSHRWHPSWAYVESMLNVSHQNPGIAGSINPFVTIDEKGKIIKEPYAEDIEKLMPYCLSK